MKLQPIIFILIIIASISCGARNGKQLADLNKPPFVPNNISNDSLSFPLDWLGYWEGELNIYNEYGLKQQVPMSLDLSKTDTVGLYNWTMIYGKDSTAQKRLYQLQEVDRSIGHYLIDEKNGILLDAYLMQNELNSIFEVMGNTLMTSYKRENDEMIFSVKFFPTTEVRVSGDTIVDNQNIPKVNSYKLSISQIARLQKKCLVE